MCGIVGIYGRNGAPVDLAALQRMADVQRHRGPDAQGFCTFSLAAGALKNKVDPQRGAPTTDEGAFGFNRLSILDLSEHGHQPMANGHGNIVIAYNGETYNAFEHRAELESRGYTFRSNTDTEIVLCLYEEFGIEGVLERLNGMYAFAIADLRKRKLFLARDRFGIKPLYWTESGGVVLFSSEVKSFLQHPSFRARLCEDHFAEYLAFRYCAEDRFLLQGVRQVQPSEWIELDADGQRAHRYWDLPRPRPRQVGLDVAVTEIERRLSHAVHAQLRSDVPVGCQLSGGIDSSLITRIANERKSGPDQFQAFSVVVRGEGFTEEKWIDEAVSSVGVTCHKYHLDEHEIARRLSRATWHLDQPLNHPNSVGMMMLAERAHEDVTVMLSGEGADELFGGYPRFFRAKALPWIQPFVPVLGHLPVWGPKFARFGVGAARDQIEWLIRASAYMRPDSISDIAGIGNLDRVWDQRRALVPADGDFVSRVLRYEQRTHLVELLVRADKMTMAHSIENRVPFLDHEIAEHVATLPTKYLVDLRARRQAVMHGTKIVLKRVAERHFPRSFVYRWKEGFGLPIAAMFKTPAMRTLMEDTVLPSVKRRGLLRATVLRHWWEEKNHDDFYVEALWGAVAFELWAIQFLD